jgi:hypothetical protein
MAGLLGQYDCELAVKRNASLAYGLANYRRFLL